jgi:hypothetical protein
MSLLSELRATKLDRARAAEALARTFECWRAPGSRWRARLAQTHPVFSAEVVHEGVERALQQWDLPALRALQQSELRGHFVAPQVTASWLAGCIPSAAFAALALPLLAGSRVYAKPASADPVSPRLFVESLREVDPKIGACITLGDDPRALAESDAVVAAGADDSVRAIHEQTFPSVPFVAHPHKLSLACIGSDVDLESAAERAAYEVCLWDGRGCLSPAWMLVLDAPRGRAEHFGQALSEALIRTSAALPIGSLTPAEHATLRQRRGESAVQSDVRLWTSGHDHAWTVSLHLDGALPSPGALRFLPLVSVESTEAIHSLAASLRPWLSTIGHAGWRAGSDLLQTALVAGGGSRLCALGQMQMPPLAWRHDGIDPIRSLLRGIDVERE